MASERTNLSPKRVAVFLTAISVDDDDLTRRWPVSPQTLSLVGCSLSGQRLVTWMSMMSSTDRRCTRRCWGTSPDR